MTVPDFARKSKITISVKAKDNIGKQNVGVTILVPAP